MAGLDAYGALALDHDGSVLWCKDGVDGQDYQGHADAIHLTPMNPDNPTQLYVFTPSEEAPSTLNGTLSNAANGSRINGIFSKPADIGRGVAANITPKPGFEFWVNQPNSETDPRGSLFNMKGEIIATNPPSNMSTNWLAYWDGDLLSELADSYNMARNSMAQCVYKYDWETNELTRIANFAGTRTNNSTKNTPCLSADLFGDWREEFMVRNEDDTELRIYMTDYETEYAIYTLMQDPVYRNAVANQNTAYNQPPRVGFYLGEDNRDQVLAMGLPTPNIRYTATISETPSNPETPDNPGTPGSSSNPSTTTPPVTTNTADQGGTTTAETTAKPSATTKGDTATAAVNSSMGDEIVKQAVKNESATVVIAPEVKGDVSRIEVSIPVPVANEIGDKTNANLTVSTPVGNVSIPNQALTELGAGSKNLTVSLEKVSDAVSVDVSVDGKIIDAVPGGIKAAIPIKDGQVAVIVDADGNETVVRKSLVEDGVAYMVLDGSATVKVVDKKTEYSDVDNDQWFSGAVEFASSHELFRGTGENTFVPNAPMNRAMLATVLWRLEGETAPSSAAAFQDVADGTWYTESVAWASEIGIITGTGNGSFSPTRDVTRQEMAVMLYRYAVKTGLDTTKKADIGTFADAGAVADWAKEAMEWAVAVGLIQGKGNSSIDATGAASRAQVATIFERLVKLQVK